MDTANDVEAAPPESTPQPALPGMPQVAWSVPGPRILGSALANNTDGPCARQSPRQLQSLSPRQLSTPSICSASTEAQLQSSLRKATSWAVERVVSGNLGGSAPAPPVSELQETFLCPVCFENQAVEERRVLDACGDESHGSCEECSLQYFKGRVDEGRISELFCLLGVASKGCGDDGVPALVSEDELEAILSKAPGAFLRYQRLKAKKADANIRECPACQKLCLPEMLEEDLLNPDMRCSDCGAYFCYYHSWGHREDGNCAAFEARLVRETQANASAFEMQACPGCGWQTEKNGGCNHMTCQQCKCNWCWICAKPIVGVVGWHYDAQNPESGCMQFSRAGQHPPPGNVRAQRAARLLAWQRTRCITCPVRILAKSMMISAICICFITLGPVEIILGMCCCCCCCCLLKKRDEETGCGLEDVIVTFSGINGTIGIFIGLACILILWIAWIPFALLLFIVFACCRRHKGSFRILLMAPFTGVVEGFVATHNVAQLDGANDDDTHPIL